MSNEKININRNEIITLYSNIKQLHKKYLAKNKVKLPGLRRGKNFTINAITLCLLYKYIGKPITKKQITTVVRKYYPDSPDSQQARHLARQSGYYILSKDRGDDGTENMPKGSYKLVTLLTPYPKYNGEDGHRSIKGKYDFEEIKRKYRNRCATCGSEENKKNLINPSRITHLHEGHMNPREPKEEKNIIPQCSECNQAYLDKFIFSRDGRVSDINIESKYWKNKYIKISKNKLKNS